MSQINIGDDPLGPSFTPISLQINSQAFITGATTLSLTITPQSTPPPSMTFVLSYYTVASASQAVGQEAEAGANLIIELDPLPDSADHYFVNPPMTIPLYGSTAVYNLETKINITELAGKTLVIMAYSNSPQMVTNTAAVSIPIANPPSS